MNLDALFRRTANSQKHLPAILNQEGDCELTYEELDCAIEDTCRSLEALGLKAGACIGLHYESGVDYIVLTYAVWRAGACVVPISLDLSPAEKTRIFDEIAIDGAISLAGTIDKLDLKIEGEVHTVGSRYEFALITPSRSHPEKFHDIHSAFLRFSSGTTGTAKGVILSHETIFARIEAANEVLKLGSSDKVLWLLSMAYHFAVSIVAYLTYGCAIILCRNQRGIAVASTAQRTNATMIYGAPLHYEWMLQDCPEQFPLASIRFAIATTAAARPNLSSRFHQKFGVPVNRALGIIEVGLPCIDLDPLGSKEGAVGQVLPAYSLELRPVAPGSEHKEIVFRGPGMFDAYYHPFSRREDLSPEGWFATGDLGELDSDGRLYMLGRIKEVINIGGMKIFPADIESIFNGHPQVLESCAYAHAHPVQGEVPYISVVLKPEAEGEGCNEQSLRQYAILNLPAYAVPNQIVIVDALPRTASGKLIRRESAHPLPAPRPTKRFNSKLIA